MAASMNDEVLRKMLEEIQQPGSDMNKLIEGLAKNASGSKQSSLGQLDMYIAFMREIANELQSEQTVELIDEALSMFDVSLDVAMPIIEHLYVTILAKSETVGNAHRESQYKAYKHYTSLGFTDEQAFALISKDSNTAKSATAISQFANSLAKEMKK